MIKNIDRKSREDFMNIYDTSALYNQNMSKEMQKCLLEFYHDVFDGYVVKNVHDCSIGAGGTTLPLARMGYNVSGSDLSESLLNKAKENFETAGYQVDLFVSDFRDLKIHLKKEYDCILTTGNSLPHIPNDDVRDFIRVTSKAIKPDGLLFVDMRNWDKVVNERPIFNARDPFIMTKEEHTSLYQIWDWHDDGSVDFIFVTSTDVNGRHDRKTFTYAPRYYPLRLRDFEKMLNEHGFVIKKYFDMDKYWLNAEIDGDKTGDFESDFDKINWYGILVQKIGK